MKRRVYFRFQVFERFQPWLIFLFLWYSNEEVEIFHFIFEPCICKWSFVHRYCKNDPVTRSSAVRTRLLVSQLTVSMSFLSLRWTLDATEYEGGWVTRSRILCRLWCMHKRRTSPSHATHYSLVDQRPWRESAVGFLWRPLSLVKRAMDRDIKERKSRRYFFWVSPGTCRATLWQKYLRCQPFTITRRSLSTMVLWL
jgi:hypothetical protein